MTIWINEPHNESEKDLALSINLNIFFDDETRSIDQTQDAIENRDHLDCHRHLDSDSRHYTLEGNKA